MGDSFFIFASWFVAVCVSVALAGTMAKKRKRDTEGWILLGAFIGPLALLLLYLLGEGEPPTLEQRRAKAQASALLSGGIILALFFTMAIPFLRACFRF